MTGALHIYHIINSYEMSITLTRVPFCMFTQFYCVFAMCHIRVGTSEVQYNFVPHLGCDTQICPKRLSNIPAPSIYQHSTYIKRTLKGHFPRPAETNPYMGQFLQDGENVRLAPFFFKVKRSYSSEHDRATTFS